MSRWHSYINSAAACIQSYTGTQPLQHFLKAHFAQHKKFGSKDRKYISHLCYSYYRTGHSLPNTSLPEKLQIALFICNETPGEWQPLYNEEWLQHWHTDATKKMQFIQELYTTFKPDNIFPWQQQLSKTIDANSFALSHLVQPYLFIRCRPGYKAIVAEKLAQNNIPYTPLLQNCFALSNTTQLQDIIALNKEAVVQDLNSQQIGSLMQMVADAQPKASHPMKVWDCCAASGGKSILAKDILGNIELMASDLRPAIINNLKARFKQAVINHYTAFVADLTQPLTLIQKQSFPFIICDAPCSGSGTWSRTPEQLYYFTVDRINYYSQLQKNIVQHIVPKLAVKGYLLYITCSVFEQENEAMVTHIMQQYGLQLIQQQVFSGYTQHADTMFAALLYKN